MRRRLLSPNITRQILATQRCFLPTISAPLTLPFTCRTLQTSHPKGAISNIKMIWVNWYYDTNGTLAENTPGNALTVTASIEYPAGVLTPVTFNGASSISMADGGQVTCDTVRNLIIPANTQFYIRTCYAGGTLNTPLSVLPANINTLNTGEQYAFTDTTVSGSMAAAGAFPNLTCPIAVIADVAARNAKGYIIAGDSIPWGAGDVSNTDANGNSGYLARALIKQGAYTKFSCPAQGVHEALSATTKLSALLATLRGHYTDLVCQYGVNDIRLRGNPAQLKTDLQSYWSLYTCGKISQCTVTPRSSSTDNWLTAVNQTPSLDNGAATQPADLASVNSWIRAIATGMNNCVESGNAFSNTSDSGIYAVPSLTLDGAHPTSAAAAQFGAAIAASLY